MLKKCALWCGTREEKLRSISALWQQRKKDAEEGIRRSIHLHLYHSLPRTLVTFQPQLCLNQKQWEFQQKKSAPQHHGFCRCTIIVVESWVGSIIINEVIKRGRDRVRYGNSATSFWDFLRYTSYICRGGGGVPKGEKPFLNYTRTDPLSSESPRHCKGLHQRPLHHLKMPFFPPSLCLSPMKHLLPLSATYLHICSSLSPTQMTMGRKDSCHNQIKHASLSLPGRFHREENKSKEKNGINTSQRSANLKQQSMLLARHFLPLSHCTDRLPLHEYLQSFSFTAYSLLQQR